MKNLISGEDLAKDVGSNVLRTGSLDRTEQLTTPCGWRKTSNSKTNLITVFFCFKWFSKAGSAHHLYVESREDASGINTTSA